MKTLAPYDFFIAQKLDELPQQWEALAKGNLFLSTDYLRGLQLAAPINMKCYFIGIKNHQGDLVGIALAQYLDMNLLDSFGERDRCVKTTLRNFIFKRFSSQVLFIGNNMLTGQNAFIFSDSCEPEKALITLRMAADALAKSIGKTGKKIHLQTFKDFSSKEAGLFKNAGFDRYLKFSTQPNMILDIPKNWINIDAYISDLSKKYRDQYKRARKKSEGIEKRKMQLEDIVNYQQTIYELYHHVALNAPFNTFFLPQDHFRSLKENLGDRFLFYGYFLDGKLIGFNTLIKNGKTLDTYFLGYDQNLQRQHMLYLNMLYDMITYGINKGFTTIVFARTALEIKSSIGAKPQEVYGFMKHRNSAVNKKLARIFEYLEPKTQWQQRNPFKNELPTPEAEQ